MTTLFSDFRSPTQDLLFVSALRTPIPDRFLRLHPLASASPIKGPYPHRAGERTSGQPYVRNAKPYSVVLSTAIGGRALVRYLELDWRLSLELRAGWVSADARRGGIRQDDKALHTDQPLLRTAFQHRLKRMLWDIALPSDNHRTTETRASNPLPPTV